MKKKFHVVSLGPGGSELVTLSALLTLVESQIIFVTTKDKNFSFDSLQKKSRSFSILQELSKLSRTVLQTPLQLETVNQSFLNEKKEIDRNISYVVPLYHPMTYSEENWQRQSTIILTALENFSSVAYTTLGDAAIYSTAYYLLDFLEKDESQILEQTQVIPGITSFSLASAKVKKPLCLGDSALLVRPLLEKKYPTTTIYMRPHKNKSYETIKENGEVYFFSHLNFANEKIENTKKKLAQSYLEIVIDFAK